MSKILEMRKESYVLSKLHEGITTEGRENILALAETLMDEAVSFGTFKDKIDGAMISEAATPSDWVDTDHWSYKLTVKQFEEIAKLAKERGMTEEKWDNEWGHFDVSFRKRSPWHSVQAQAIYNPDSPKDTWISRVAVDSKTVWEKNYHKALGSESALKSDYAEQLRKLKEALSKMKESEECDCKEDDEEQLKEEQGLVYGEKAIPSWIDQSNWSWKLTKEFVDDIRKMFLKRWNEKGIFVDEYWRTQVNSKRKWWSVTFDCKKSWDRNHKPYLLISITQGLNNPSITWVDAISCNKRTFSHFDTPHPEKFDIANIGVIDSFKAKSTLKDFYKKMKDEIKDWMERAYYEAEEKPMSGNRLTEMRKESYVLSKLHEGMNPDVKDKVLEYAQKLWKEADDFKDFKETMDIAVRDLEGAPKKELKENGVEGVSLDKRKALVRKQANALEALCKKYGFEKDSASHGSINGGELEYYFTKGKTTVEIITYPRDGVTAYISIKKDGNKKYIWNLDKHPWLQMYNFDKGPLKLSVSDIEREYEKQLKDLEAELKSVKESDSEDDIMESVMRLGGYTISEAEFYDYTASAETMNQLDAIQKVLKDKRWKMISELKTRGTIAWRFVPDPTNGHSYLRDTAVTVIWNTLQDNGRAFIYHVDYCGEVLPIPHGKSLAKEIWEKNWTKDNVNSFYKKQLEALKKVVR